MDITNFLGISIVGTALSLIFQYFKTSSNTASKLWVVGLSIIVGAIYVFFRGTIWWETILGVLAASSTVYALFLNK